MGNTKHTKEQIRERIQQKKLLFDGAFGTYYGGKYDTKQLPELANLEAPERVKEIHTEYLEAGAQILRTNTFAANSFCMDRSKEQIEETLRSGVRLAREAVAAWRERTGETKEVYIAGDIGQIPGMRWHRRILYAANTKRSVVFFWKKTWTFLSLKHFPRWKSSCLRSK